MMPEHLSPLANHLWQSTVFAGVVGVLAFALRKNRASPRYALWMAASVKFLVPFSLLVAVGAWIEWPAATAQQPAAFLSVVREANAPFGPALSDIVPPPSSIVAVRPVGSALPLALTAIWLTGSGVVALSWLREWRRLRRGMKGAIPIDLDFPIPVLSWDASLEPGIFGIFRPVLLLPEGITEHLTPRELHAVLVHEQCHVRRRDNLCAAIHVVVEVLFWFHPLVWWIERRLTEERERACDEAVIHRMGDPDSYAEGILKVCRFYKESAAICVSGVMGGHLRRRIEWIMSGDRLASLNLGKIALLAVVGAGGLGVPIIAGLAPTPQSEEFAVASIRPIPPGTLVAARTLGVACRGIDGLRQTATAARIGVDPVLDAPRGRCVANGVVAQSLIGFAYGLPAHYIAGGPDWIRNTGPIGIDPGGFTHHEAETYSIEAQAPDTATVTTEQLREMLRQMLETRYGLEAHRETQEVEGYALTVTESGPTLVQVTDGYESPRVTFDLDRGRVIRGTSSLAELVALLVPGEAVADRTGLTGLYTYEIVVPLPPPPPAPPPPPGPGTPGVAGGPGGVVESQELRSRSDPIREVSAVLEEEMGLRLQAALVPVQMLVIDRVERPSAN